MKTSLINSCGFESYPQESVSSYPVAKSCELAMSYEQIVSNAKERIKHIYDSVARGLHPDPTPFVLGIIDPSLNMLLLEATGIVVKSDVIYSSAATLTHHMKGTKSMRGKIISEVEAISIPDSLHAMKVFAHSGAFVFTDYKIKVIVTPNKRIKINRKKTIVANHTSTSRVIDINEFSNGDYIKIK